MNILCLLLAVVAVDFSQEVRPVRPALHSAGFAPRSHPRKPAEDAAVKSMNLAFTRTHDWALVNSNQRVIDYQHIFPLVGKDPKDPSNYYFFATDHLLELARGVGLDIFYRLGTSIEHTGSDWQCNTLVPKDFDATAEVFAGIVRHYNRGWADGKEWDIKYWEIWNEPESHAHMWCEPGRGWHWGKNDADGLKDFVYLRDKFIVFFVKCLKRLKSEFGDSIKVGGPALMECSVIPIRPEYDIFPMLLKACKEAGVKPDFLSWHCYSEDPEEPFRQLEKVKKDIAAVGWNDIELIINEWHYLRNWEGLSRTDEAEYVKSYFGPTAQNGIDSAAFTLSVLTRFQYSDYDQAYFYGLESGSSSFGFSKPVPYVNEFNKNYYALKAFGSLMDSKAKVCAAKNDGTVSVFPVKGADGVARLLVTDYRGKSDTLEIEVKGVPAGAKVSGSVLDQFSDEGVANLEFTDGRLILHKRDRNSAAFLVRFD